MPQIWYVQNTKGMHPTQRKELGKASWKADNWSMPCRLREQLGFLHMVTLKVKCMQRRWF